MGSLLPSLISPLLSCCGGLKILLATRGPRVSQSQGNTCQGGAGPAHQAWAECLALGEHLFTRTTGHL